MSDPRPAPLTDLETHFQAIRAHYLPLMGRFVRSDEWDIDAYAWKAPHVGIRLSPIEEMLWEEIRLANLVMYPQFPVSGYYVDFGNPAAKVAIECDGAQFHTDVRADEKRQRYIEARGWTVYRISGRHCNASEIEREDEYGHSFVERSPSQQFLAEIAERHPIKRVFKPGPITAPKRLGDLMAAMLDRLQAQHSERSDA